MRRKKRKAQKPTLGLYPSHSSPALSTLQNELSFLQKKRQEIITLTEQLQEVISQLTTISSRYNSKSSPFALHLNSEYNSLRKKRKSLQKKISKLPSLELLTININATHKKITVLRSTLKSPVIVKPIVDQIYSEEFDWSLVSFQDNYISVFHNNHWLERFPIQNSRKAFNLIKSHYKFTNAPKLSIETNGKSIIRILNFEVLFYYILLLQNLGSTFDKSMLVEIKKFIRFTKSYYKKYLPKLLQSRCFSFLCEYSTSDLPIVPVPEMVKGINKKWIIHDSFLFPVSKKGKVFWIWESVEESKATYIFETPIQEFLPDLQKLFDYLTGDIVNKRQTLLNSPKLQSYLNYINRKKHDSFEDWKVDIKPYLL